MKHLKKFNESKKEKWIPYAKINTAEWERKTNSVIKFEDKYVNELESIMDNNTYNHSDPWDNGAIYKLNKYTGSYHDDTKEFCLLPNAGIGNTIYLIQQCDDEWFIIKGEHSEKADSDPNKIVGYWKCDGWDGFKEFLKSNTRLRF